MSAHQPQTVIVIRSFQESGGREGAIKRGLVGSLPLLGAARREQFTAKRRQSIAPVKNRGRSFKATGGLNTRTSRVNDANQSTRIVGKSSHFIAPSASASHEQQGLMRKFGNVRKAVGEIRNV